MTIVAAEYATVAEMLASAEDDTALPEGTFVRVLDGGHRYRVQPPDWTGVGLQNSATSPVRFEVLPTDQGAFNVRAFNAVGDGLTDDTRAIQAAIDAVPATGGKVFLPAGLYLVDMQTGLFVKSFLTLEGVHEQAAQLLCSPHPGTLIRRADPPGDFQRVYVQRVNIRNLGIILHHPRPAAPENYEQVAIQLRHVTRSVLENLYIGNIVSGVSEAWADRIDGLSTSLPKADARQGIGISIGTSSASSEFYSGGEVNELRHCDIWGVRKGVVIDDPEMLERKTGDASAGYAVLVQSCEVQRATIGFAQYGKYGAGHTFIHNKVQDIGPRDASLSACYLIEGYQNILMGGYVEAPDAQFILQLGSSSRNNRVLPFLHSDESRIVDLGVNNVLEVLDPDPANRRYEMRVDDADDRIRFLKASVKFYWSGKEVVIEDALNVESVTRNGVGDYTVSFAAFTMRSAHYVMVQSCSVDNGDGAPGTIYIRRYDDQQVNHVRVISYNLATASRADFTINALAFFEPE